MEASYNLLSETEPSDVQLQMLMNSVLIEVKAKAEISSQKYQALQVQLIKDAFERRKTSI